MRVSETCDLSGRCLCGAVRVTGTIADPALNACHCGQCRRWSGHVWASVTPDDLTITGPVRWFRSSATAERGFCEACGSSLFWRRIGAAAVDVAAGCLDAPTGLALTGHIFVANKGDYYAIDDGRPQDARE